MKEKIRDFCVYHVNSTFLFKFSMLLFIISTLRHGDSSLVMIRANEQSYLGESKVLQYFSNVRYNLLLSFLFQLEAVFRESGFELKKKRSRRYPAKTITYADYADDIALLSNTPNEAETLLHNLERAAAGIGLHVNAHKTEYMCYNQTDNISTLDGTSLKLVDKFTYQGSSVSSTEKDIDTRLTKAFTVIDRLSIIWKSDLTDKMKRSFFQAAVVSILLYGCTT